MFGYLKPDMPYLYLKDDTLYKSLYCGVCKSIGKNLSQSARFGLTYDIAFFSAYVHNVTGEDVEIKRKRCVAHLIKRRPMATPDALTNLCAHINVALCYYKVKDDVIDDDGGRIKSLFFKRGVNKVKKKYPEITEIIENRYEELRKLEKNKCDSVDMAGEPFACMMQELLKFALKSTDTGDYVSSERLFYFLGKWIYLIDALDDYDKDVKGKKYNPLYYAYGNCQNLKELTEKHGKDVAFAFSDIFANINAELKNCKFKFNHDLIDNILTRGLPAVTMKILKKGNKEK